MSHQLGRTKAGAKQSTLYPSSTNFPRAPGNLVPPHPQASWRHGAARWGQDAENGKNGHLWLPARVAFVAIL